jgi:death-on-curing family protein
MTEPRWLTLDAVIDMHAEQLAMFGGPEGIRDRGLLESALDRPRNKFAYGEDDLAALAAAYAFGLARNHPFIDGNKRIAFHALMVFLRVNGVRFAPPSPSRDSHHPRACRRRGRRGRPDPLDQGQLAGCLTTLASGQWTPYLRLAANPECRCRRATTKPTALPAACRAMPASARMSPGAAASIAAARLFGASLDREKNAADLTRALGGLKGPIMKVAQLLATIPEVLPPEYVAELQKLQSEAPPMGPAFVKRRMMAELGPDWEKRFATFDKVPAAAASLGQVHRATAHDGMRLAVKLQYPDMQSAVEADLAQLEILFAIQRRMDPAIDTREIIKEIGERVREELDYRREAKHAALYQDVLSEEPLVRVPTVRPELSTGRLLTLSWLDGTKMLSHVDQPLAIRNRLATAMFRGMVAPLHPYRRDPRRPASRQLHRLRRRRRARRHQSAGLRLRAHLPPRFIAAVIDLYKGLETNDDARVVHAYETWGFKNLTRELIAVLNVWARFIYGPLLDDRVRSIADGVAPGEYGRREAFQVHKALKEKGPVTIPQEFVLMDRAAIGLGGVFLHLKAELNFYRLYNEEIDRFGLEQVSARQNAALGAAGLKAA